MCTAKNQINPKEKPSVYSFLCIYQRYGMFRLRMRTLLGGVAVPQSGIRCSTSAQNDKILKDFSKRIICQIKIYPLRFIFSSFLPTKKEELFTPPKNYFLCFFLFKKAFGCFFKLISYMYVLWTNFFAFSVFSCCLITSSLPKYAI